MTKSELDVLGCLLGRRIGATTSSPGPYRDIIGGRAHRVCLALQEAGLGRCRDVNPHAFVFETHAMIYEQEFEKGRDDFTSHRRRAHAPFYPDRAAGYDAAKAAASGEGAGR